MRPPLIFILLLFIYSCQRKANNPITTENLIDEYLSEYNQENLSVNDPIIIRFSQTIINEVNPESIFEIRPKISGNIAWSDPQTLIFDPSERLDYDEKYQVSVSLEPLFDQASRNDILTFAVNTKPLEYMIAMDPVVVYSEQRASLSGEIQSSDWAGEEVVRELIDTDQTDTKINWSHSANGTLHRFKIENITRTATTSTISVFWNDRNNPKGFSGEKKYIIAPKGNFAVADIRTDTESKSIIIQFTDALEPKQRLEGLVTISAYQGKMRYDIEGSVLTIYPIGKLKDKENITVSKTIKSDKGNQLSENVIAQIDLEPVKPQVRLAGNGVITPYTDAVVFPFEAIGLHTVDVEIFKVFENNVLQYLQNNKLDQRSYYLDPVGRIIHQQKVDLSELSANPDYHRWTRYALDLQNLTDVDPGALYIVRIGFRGIYTDYPCEEGVQEEPLQNMETPTSIMRWNSNYPGYRYSQRNNPCYPVYYNESNFVQRNLLASNLAIIAKGGKDRRYHFLARDLKSLKPIPGVNIKLFDFQQQNMINGITESDGSLILEVSGKPSFVIANKQQEYAYLNIRDEQSNSLSDFSISGSEKKEGIDGYLYGERGVWRPGDTLFLTFVLEDSHQSLPTDYPMSIEIKDARGNHYYSEKFHRSPGDMYAFGIPTTSTDKTGNWQARVEVGESVFQKTLKVETVKPNRLSIDLDLPQEINLAKEKDFGITGKWLHGAPAAGLRAKIESSLSSIKTSFNDYKEYNFDDPARRLSHNNTIIFDQVLSAQGKGRWSLEKIAQHQPPGKLRLSLKTKLFEKTGEFSIDQTSTALSFYKSYTGIRLPENPWGRKYLSREDDSEISFVVVSESGQPIANRTLEIGLYEAEWTWWYNRTNSNIYKYDQSNHLNAIEKISLTTDGQGKVSWKPKQISGYRYLVRACDPESGHCTGELFYTPYYDFQSNEGAASVLHLKTEKNAYQIGEKITLDVPSSEDTKILVTIENGHGVLDKKWYDGNANATRIVLETNNTMTPNIYVHVSLIQKYDNNISELPLRMYGVLPLQIIDPETQLAPTISMDREIRPNNNYEVKVSEKEGREMYYTLAVVDEGLLGLTRFQTPNLWNHFYAKQALAVKTWDLYDLVLKGHGGEVDKYISIGGDGEVLGDSGDREANRFSPVVRFLGPFYLPPGQTLTHDLVMENYMGAVRVMVVSRNGRAYGVAAKTVPVKNPIMVLPTMPRVLSPGETFALPVNVFVTHDNINEVNISIELGPGLAAKGLRGQILKFENPQEQIAQFSIKIAPDYQGSSFVKVIANGSGQSISQQIDFKIENPNPLIHKSIEKVIAAGESVTIPYELIGMTGTQTASVEVSNFPSINLESRLDYLIRYPYGCIEQTTSSVFPQLYLAEMVELSSTEKSSVKKNIQAAIKRIKKFQKSNGGFTYWIGSNETSDWGSSYAGHFLLEAKEKGYFVANSTINHWLDFQKTVARNWNNVHSHPYVNLMQAYRLYTLAKAGHPAWGAMNSLRHQSLNPTSVYTLAAAYAAGGQTSMAEELIAGVNYEVKDYHMLGHTYGSSLRDKALVAEALLSSSFGKEHFGATSKILEIARDLGKEEWYSTQTTAFALLAVGKYLERNPPGELTGSITLEGGVKENIKTSAPIYQKELTINGQASPQVTITNQSQGVFYARVNLSGQANYGTETAMARNLKMTVTYKDLEGNVLDVDYLPQGTDFLAEVTISNPGSRAYSLDEMALSQIFPSGWEIQNDRLSGKNTTVNDRYEYQDIRDDRIYTFFDMQKKKTYRTRLTASYAGEYYLPDVQCEAMYDHQILARIPGRWITVTKNREL